MKKILLFFFGVLCMISLISGATWGGNWSNSAVAYWPFYESSGLSFDENVSHVYNGTTSDVRCAGKFGNGLCFNGTTGMGYTNVTALNISFINLTQFSYGGWILLKGDWGLLIGNDLDSGGFSMDTANDGKINCRINGGSTASSVNAISRYVWHQVYCVFDNANNNISIYLDGAYNNSMAFSEAVSVHPLNYFIKFGRHGDAFPLNGSIDEMEVLNRSLGATEILLRYNSGNGCQYGNESCFPASPDTTSPNITSPANATITYKESLFVDFDAVDDVAVDSFSVNDTTRFQINSTGGLTNKTILPAGTWLVNVSVNDTSGNMTYSMWKVVVNKAMLIGNLNNTYEVWSYELENSTNISFIEGNSGDDDVNYTIYNNSIYILNNTNFSGAIGTYIIVLNSTGGSNYTANTSIATKNLIFGDTIPPVVAIQSPINAFVYTTSPTKLNYTASDSLLSSCWYSIDNGATNSSPTASCSNVTSMSAITGNNTWRVYANDTSGNQGYAEVIFNYTGTSLGGGQYGNPGSYDFTASLVKEAEKSIENEPKTLAQLVNEWSKNKVVVVIFILLLLLWITSNAKSKRR